MPRNAATKAARLSIAPMEDRTEAVVMRDGWSARMCGPCARDDFRTFEAPRLERRRWHFARHAFQFYAATRGTTLSTNRRNRELQAPATNDTCDASAGPAAEVFCVWASRAPGSSVAPSRRKAHRDPKSVQWLGQGRELPGHSARATSMIRTRRRKSRRKPLSPCLGCLRHIWLMQAAPPVHRRGATSPRPKRSCGRPGAGAPRLRCGSVRRDA